MSEALRARLLVPAPFVGVDGASGSSPLEPRASAVWVLDPGEAEAAGAGSALPAELMETAALELPAVGRPSTSCVRAAAESSTPAKPAGSFVPQPSAMAPVVMMLSRFVFQRPLLMYLPAKHPGVQVD